MKLAIQNRFDGGIAEDVRTSSTSECYYSRGFDLIGTPSTLVHHVDQVNETDGAQTVNDNQITDVGMTTISGTNYMIAFGRDSAASALPAAFTRTAYDFNGNWTKQATGVVGTTQIKGTYIQYGGISFILTRNSTTYNLQKYTGAGTLVSVGTFTSTAGAVVPRPYIHPEDKILYMAVGTVIATYNIATGTFSSVSTILPTGYSATSISHYGGYLAIGVVPDLPGDSLMLLWGRDTTLNTLQGSVNMGRTYLQSLQNIEGTVIGVSTSYSSGGFVNKTVEIKGYYGGESYQLLKTISILGDSVVATNYNIVSARKDESLYFAIGGEKAVHRVCKNKAGRWVVTQDRLIAEDGGAVDNVYSISFVNDIMYVAYSQSGVYKLSATSENFNLATAKADEAVYTQSINCGVAEADKLVEKKLVHVEVLFEGMSTSGTATVNCIIDGTTALVQTKNNVSGNFVVKGQAESTGKPFKIGRDIQIQVKTAYGTNVKEIRYKYEPLNLI